MALISPPKSFAWGDQWKRWLNTLYTWVSDSNVKVIPTADLPAANTQAEGRIIIEDAGAGDRNLIIYAEGQRFRIDGGAAF